MRGLNRIEEREGGIEEEGIREGGGGVVRGSDGRHGAKMGSKEGRGGGMKWKGSGAEGREGRGRGKGGVMGTKSAGTL